MIHMFPLRIMVLIFLVLIYPFFFLIVIYFCYLSPDGSVFVSLNWIFEQCLLLYYIFKERRELLIMAFT